MNSVKFALFVNLLYILFQAAAPAENPVEFQRITQIPRNSPTKFANYAKFAPFVNISYVSDTCPGRELQRIMQIPCSSPTYSANHVKFAKFANIIYYVSEACPSRESSAIPANYANSAQFAHTVHESHEIRTIC